MAERRLVIPPAATAVVALAVAAMIALGVWQLQRARWKDGLIARYLAAERLPLTAWPAVPPPDDRLLFRHARGACLQVVGWQVTAGRNRVGESGWRHIARCRSLGAEGPGMLVDAGWSDRWDAKVAWTGGPVSGIVTTGPDARTLIEIWFSPSRKPTPLLVAETPAAGLQPSEPPDPRQLPQNHRAYAVQWFAFALIAVIIYGIAVAKRGREPPPG